MLTNRYERWFGPIPRIDALMTPEAKIASLLEHDASIGLIEHPEFSVAIEAATSLLAATRDRLIKIEKDRRSVGAIVETTGVTARQLSKFVTPDHERLCVGILPGAPLGGLIKYGHAIIKAGFHPLICLAPEFDPADAMRLWSALERPPKGAPLAGRGIFIHPQ